MYSGVCLTSGSLARYCSVWITCTKLPLHFSEKLTVWPKALSYSISWPSSYHLQHHFAKMLIKSKVRSNLSTDNPLAELQQTFGQNLNSGSIHWSKFHFVLPSLHLAFLLCHHKELIKSLSLKSVGVYKTLRTTRGLKGWKYLELQIIQNYLCKGLGKTYLHLWSVCLFINCQVVTRQMFHYLTNLKSVSKWGIPILSILWLCKADYNNPPQHWLASLTLSLSYLPEV